MLILACALFQWLDVRYRFSRQTSLTAYSFGLDFTHFDIDMWDEDSGWDFSRDHPNDLASYFWLGNPITPFDTGCYSVVLPWWYLIIPLSATTFLIFRLTRRSPTGQAFPIESQRII
jgi:hypothetical protein